ncbi:MAG: ISNCY family transposase [Terriglobia bacterium]
MQEERMAMSQQERDWLKTLSEAKKKQITQREAAERLGVSQRHVRRMLRKLRGMGDKAVIHGLRGRASNRKIPAATEQKAIELVRAEYADFGPTLAAEYLEQEHELQVSRETLRKWMRKAGLWKARHQRIEQVHVWRPRRSCVGELVQWDTSDHDWLEGRGPRIYLMAMIDDATSRLLAQFVSSDSTEQNMRLLWAYLEKYGRPVAFYTDKASLFRVNRPAQLEEQLAGQDPKTQIGRALEELDVGWIAAHSPQAKGRVERCFQTLQDRLVKGLRKAHVTTLEEANQYLHRHFLPLWNRRFTVAPANSADAHRPLGPEQNLGASLSHCETRVVTNDYTIRFQGQAYQIARADIQAGLRGARIRVESRLDGSIAVRFREHYLSVAASQPQPQPVRPVRAAKPASPPASQRPRGSWMRNFNLQSGPPVWAALRDSNTHEGTSRD